MSRSAPTAFLVHDGAQLLRAPSGDERSKAAPTAPLAGAILASRGGSIQESGEGAPPLSSPSSPSSRAFCICQRHTALTNRFSTFAQQLQALEHQPPESHRQRQGPLTIGHSREDFPEVGRCLVGPSRSAGR